MEAFITLSRIRTKLTAIPAALIHHNEAIEAAVVMAHPQTESPLVALPADLRVAIYEYTFYYGKVVLTRLPNQPIDRLALLRTCRQIRSEAESIFYEINDVVISAPQLHDLVRTSTQSRLDCISSITVLMHNTHHSEESLTKQCLRNLVELRNLRDLQVKFLNLAMGLVYTRREVDGVLENFRGREKRFMRQAVAKAPRLERIEVTTPHPNLNTNVFKEVETELQHAIDLRRAREAEDED